MESQKLRSLGLFLLSPAIAKHCATSENYYLAYLLFFNVHVWITRTKKCFQHYNSICFDRIVVIFTPSIAAFSVIKNSCRLIARNELMYWCFNFPHSHLLPRPCIIIIPYAALSLIGYSSAGQYS